MTAATARASYNYVFESQRTYLANCDHRCGSLVWLGSAVHGPLVFCSLFCAKRVLHGTVERHQAADAPRILRALEIYPREDALNRVCFYMPNLGLRWGEHRRTHLLAEVMNALLGPLMPSYDDTTVGAIKDPLASIVFSKSAYGERERVERREWFARQACSMLAIQEAIKRGGDGSPDGLELQPTALPLVMEEYQLETPSQVAKVLVRRHRTAPWCLIAARLAEQGHMELCDGIRGMWYRFHPGFRCCDESGQRGSDQRSAMRAVILVRPCLFDFDQMQSLMMPEWHEECIQRAIEYDSAGLLRLLLRDYGRNMPSHLLALACSRKNPVIVEIIAQHVDHVPTAIWMEAATCRNPAVMNSMRKFFECHAISHDLAQAAVMLDDVAMLTTIPHETARLMYVAVEAQAEKCFQYLLVGLEPDDIRLAFGNACTADFATGVAHILLHYGAIVRDAYFASRLCLLSYLDTRVLRVLLTDEYFGDADALCALDEGRAEDLQARLHVLANKAV